MTPSLALRYRIDCHRIDPISCRDLRKGKARRAEVPDFPDLAFGQPGVAVSFAYRDSAVTPFVGRLLKPVSPRQIREVIVCAVAIKVSRFLVLTRWPDKGHQNRSVNKHCCLRLSTGRSLYRHVPLRGRRSQHLAGGTQNPSVVADKVRWMVGNLLPGFGRCSNNEGHDLDTVPQFAIEIKGYC